MNKFVFISISILFGFAAHAGFCLDLSGTFSMNTISKPACGNGKIAIKG
ncbi:MAG: hypothetical protein H7061_13780 [Bdellovibrionaceae bacterium]|nr:hypothetical protein [Bdellovibrio sp.]